MPTPPEFSLEKLREQYPMPWTYTVLGNGVILMFDVKRQQVPLLDILNFSVFITERLAAPSQDKPT